MMPLEHFNQCIKLVLDRVDPGFHFRPLGVLWLFFVRTQDEKDELEDAYFR